MFSTVSLQFALCKATTRVNGVTGITIPVIQSAVLKTGQNRTVFTSMRNRLYFHLSRGEIHFNINCTVTNLMIFHDLPAKCMFLENKIKFSMTFHDLCKPCIYSDLDRRNTESTNNSESVSTRHGGLP